MTWYYVVYRDYPGGKPMLSSRHRTEAAAQKAIATHRHDPFWRAYFWSITTTKPE